MTRAKGRRVMSNLTFGSNSNVNEDEDVIVDSNSDVESDSDVESKKFFNIFDGTAGRPEGSYLDIQERVSAEKLRAMQEDREPDLSNVGSLPAATGTPMVPEERQVDNRYYSNPATVVLGPRDVDPVSELNVDTGDAAVNVDLSQAAQQARERKANDDAILGAVDGGGEPSEPMAVESTTTTPDASLTAGSTSSLSPEGNGGTVQY